MTTTYKSDQLTNVDSVPQVKREANEKGKLHAAFFSFTVPVGNAAIGTTIELVRLPKDARPVFANAGWEAMSTGGGAADMSLGDGTTADAFLEATSVDAAGNTAFFNIPSRQGGVALTADTSVIATVGTEAWLAGQKLIGSVHYIKD